METPKGTIILWKTGAIPTGWSVFAAANGRLIRGVLAGGSAGITAGSGTHTHTAGGAASDGAHVHGSKSFDYGYSSNTVTVSDDDGAHVVSATVTHIHTASFSLGSGGAHTHVASGTTGGASNMPPYKIGIFIIKD